MINYLDVCVHYLGGTGIPGNLARVIALIVQLIKVFVPILLIVWGMLDLGKAVMAQKEDEIKKGQQTFIKRLIAAAIVFFVVSIVTLLIGLVGGNDGQGIMGCVNSIIQCEDENCNDIE